MATVLGKRKLRTQKADPSVAQEDAMAVFRRHFEAQFKPLAPADPSTQPASTPAPEAEDMRSDSESSGASWDGVSEDDDDAEGEEEEEGSESKPDRSPPSSAVEVISHAPTPSASLLTNLSKRETKAYLSSRPPPSSTLPTATASSKRTKTATPADEDAPSLVKNDLALQRLLSESHLLSSSSAGGSGSGSGSRGTEHVGRNRHLATDLRLAALGSRDSIYAQARMPMAQRKGMAAAARGREDKRRREARENGVVLERPAAGVGKKKIGGGGSGSGGGGKSREGRGRGRPVDAPAVGRLGGGTLRLSKKDIAEIEADG